MKCPSCGKEAHLHSPGYSGIGVVGSWVSPPIWKCYCGGREHQWHDDSEESIEASDSSKTDSRANAQKWR